MSTYDMTVEDQQAFAERLKRFRKKWRLSQQDLARVLGLGRDTIGSLELCRNRPFPQTVLRVRELELKYEAVVEEELDGLTGMS